MPILMIQGTTSSAGKSLLTAALCRIFARRGLRVAPFKAQNMSNNAAVCADGAEIGRAQFTQALAACAPPEAAMNPILLKPEGDARSQVIVMGRAGGSLSARDYFQHKRQLWGVVTAALDDLRSRFDLVIIEGAGSPAELNLKHNDIVNMAVARYADAPVLLVGDIDRGGVFAQLLGTLWLLEPSERALVRGLIVNKFRGDRALFADGVGILEGRGGVPVLGVIPYLRHSLPAEDAADLATAHPSAPAPQVQIGVVRLPRIANFDDFDPLAAEPGVGLTYIERPDQVPACDAVILPGSKSTLADLAWLRAEGLVRAITAYAEQGGAVVGICGGYQMLGDHISDPDLSESNIPEAPGLGLLPLHTRFEDAKQTHQVRALITAVQGWQAAAADQPLTGYEIHVGRTEGARTWLRLIRRDGTSAADGAASPDGRVWGCYLHGLFHNEAFRRAWLISLGWQPRSPAVEAADPFDPLADSVEAALDMPALLRITGL